MAFEAGRGGSGLEPKLAGLRLTPADFAGRRRRTPQDLGRILAGPGTGPSGPAVLGGPIHASGARCALWGLRAAPEANINEAARTGIKQLTTTCIINPKRHRRCPW